MTNPPSGNPLSREQRDAIEADSTFLRTVELELSPVRGAFDAAHLREVHRRMFQDLPARGLTDVTPGEYRPPVPSGRDWVKHRGLETQAVTSTVAYSGMDADAQKRIDAALTAAHPAKLAKLKTADFVKAFGKLYAELDYVHPFGDGNSRTLRTFTKQLAADAGYAVNWERFNTSRFGRDVLYIARDLSVNKIALPLVKNDDTRRQIALSLDMLANNRELSDLLKDAIRPSRALAFEQTAQAEAMRKFPELAAAYQTQDAARKYFALEMAGKTEAQRQALAQVTKHIQERLNAGEVKAFGTVADAAGRARAPEQVPERKAPAPTRGNAQDRER